MANRLILLNSEVAVLKTWPEILVLSVTLQLTIKFCNTNMQILVLRFATMADLCKFLL